MDTDAPAAPDQPAPPGGGEEEGEPRTFYDDIRSRVLRGLVRRRALRPAARETALRLQRLFGPGLNRVALKPSSLYFLSSAAKVATYARTLCLNLRYNATLGGSVTSAVRPPPPTANSVEPSTMISIRLPTARTP